MRVERGDDGSLIFHESGQFTLAGPPARDSGASRRTPGPLRFGNVLRWSIHDDRLVLAHRRFGAEAEVTLVELVPTEPGPTEPAPAETVPAATAADTDLFSPAPHLCGNDRYHARLRLTGHGFDLIWRITGPAKDETLVHAYRG